MYDVIAYKNTGFSIGNTPDSPDLLMGMNSVVLPTTDLVQNRTITKVTVRCETGYEMIKDVDYCKIGDAFYWVTNITMSSVDTAVLDLAIDGLLSAGGIGAISIIDGTLTRACTPDDVFGKYTTPEPIAPMSPLELVVGNLIGDDGNPYNDPSGQPLVIVAATLDLSSSETEAVTYTDPATGETVAVPKMKAAQGSHQTIMQISDTQSRTAYSPLQRYYMSSSETVQKSIENARSLNQEGGIIGQFIIPREYVALVQYTAAGEISKLESDFLTEDSGLPIEYDATVKNKKVLYGEYNRFMVMSIGSGNTAEFKPEDIMEEGQANARFIIFADLRMGERPYCRPKSYLGDTKNIFQNAIPGATWADAPIVYTDKSGSQLDKILFTAEREIQADLNMRTVYESAGIKPGGGAIGMFSSVPGWFNRWLGGTVGMFGSVSPGSGEYALTADQMIGASEYAMKGDISNASEDIMNNFKSAGTKFVASQVVAPNIQFPRSDSLRDFFGNGFLIMRLKPCANDIAWMDKWHTMFGYALSNVPFTSEYLNCRQYFNYIESPNVVIDAPVPFYMREIISNQLRNGVRIWHVKPNPSYYSTGNPIVGGGN